MAIKSVSIRIEEEMLEKLGCSIYQGYYYSRPLPRDAFIEYVKGL